MWEIILSCAAIIVSVFVYIYILKRLFSECKTLKENTSKTLDGLKTFIHEKYLPIFQRETRESIMSTPSLIDDANSFCDLSYAYLNSGNDSDIESIYNRVCVLSGDNKQNQIDYNYLTYNWSDCKCGESIISGAYRITPPGISEKTYVLNGKNSDEKIVSYVNNLNKIKETRSCKC
jgi:hypothetical protein